MSDLLRGFVIFVCFTSGDRDAALFHLIFNLLNRRYWRGKGRGQLGESGVGHETHKLNRSEGHCLDERGRFVYKSVK